MVRYQYTVDLDPQLVGHSRSGPPPPRLLAHDVGFLTLGPMLNPPPFLHGDLISWTRPFPLLGILLPVTDTLPHEPCLISFITFILGSSAHSSVTAEGSFH